MGFQYYKNINKDYKNTVFKKNLLFMYYQTGNFLKVLMYSNSDSNNLFILFNTYYTKTNFTNYKIVIDYF